jgi:hypothetical protein
MLTRELLADVAVQRDFRSKPTDHTSIFKPVLIRDGATMWSRGDNYLAIPTSGPLDHSM